MSARSQLDEWKALAIEQGWSIDFSAKGHWKWKPPIGPMIVTSSSASRRAQSSLHLIKSQLKRAGLQFHEPPGSPAQEETVPKFEVVDADKAPKLRLVPVTLDGLSDRMDEVVSALRLMEDAQSALISMVEEAADQHATFVKATQESLMELRRKVKDIPAPAPPVDTSKFVTIEKLDVVLDELSQYLDAKLEEVARKADPIAAFKARLGGN